MWNSWDHGLRLRSQVGPVKSLRAQLHPPPQVLPATRFKDADGSGLPSVSNQGLCPPGLVAGIVDKPVLGNPTEKGWLQRVPRARYM